ncbi:hypothetical protein ACFU44_27370 [Nocardia rhizosphaerihabitans]|uniref:hypothetical protein n=1 Tax=Nocardia rhizosphaerihabitans TaxID=1691570 RepID=UPI00366DC428
MRFEAGAVADGEQDRGHRVRDSTGLRAQDPVATDRDRADVQFGRELRRVTHNHFEEQDRIRWWDMAFPALLSFFLVVFLALTAIDVVGDDPDDTGGGGLVDQRTRALVEIDGDGTKFERPMDPGGQRHHHHGHDEQ